MGYLSNWFIYFISLLLCVSKTKGSGPAANQTDRLALLAIKAKITNDPFNIMRSWNDSTHFCQWYGVTCGSRHQRVTQLNLPSLKLGGSISPHIGNLSFLHSLRLQANNLVHQIPNQIGRLPRLQVLDLMNNTLGGEIPVNLSSCSELRKLFLANNKLEGRIPVQLGFLSKLQSLDASHNNLFGTIPPSFGNLTHLQLLFLDSCGNLTGEIPSILGTLDNLTFLVLSANNLNGEVPSSIFNRSLMKILDLGENQITGRLPASLFNTLPNLLFFSVAINQFSGPIPLSLSNASNLDILQLSNNNFVGKVPTLQNLKFIWRLVLTGNQLGGGIGARDDLTFLCSLTNATSLTVLQMDANKFGGRFPECITNLSSQLRTLTINDNYIYGSIPRDIDNLIGLQSLFMENNSFTGFIPSTIGI